jgi:hypothetical protein
MEFTWYLVPARIKSQAVVKTAGLIKLRLPLKTINYSAFGRIPGP